MGFSKLFSAFCKSLVKSDPGRRKIRTASRLLENSTIESLEDRVVLYAASGNAWPDPRVVTISFVPDGTNLGGVSSDLNTAFNGNPNLPNWQSEILRAAQVWSQATNINFTVVTDSGAASGSGLWQQGSLLPLIGDIRIGGFNYGPGNTTLATAYAPPPDNNYSIAGDINFNTGMAFSQGNGYDLFTVAAHEFGHALGLNHASVNFMEVMWPSYNGVKSSLHADDIAGIRNIYSNNNARSKDGYETASGNDTINNAKNISGDLNKLFRWAVVSDLDITTTSDVDFYKVNMPAWTASTVEFKVQSTGLSLLAPKMTIYDSDKTTVLGTATGSGELGATLSLSLSGVDGSDTFYIKVEGANTTPFGMGAYGITIDLGALLPPLLPMPFTSLANGLIPHSGGAIAIESAIRDDFSAIDDEAPAAPTIDKVKHAIAIGKAESGSQVAVYDNGLLIGTTTADDRGNWSVNLAGKLSAGSHRLTVRATDQAGNAIVDSDSLTVTIPLRKRLGMAKRS